MALKDIESEIYAKLWQLWIADSAWATAVPIGNRIRYDLDTGNFNPEKTLEADGDKDSAELWPQSGETGLWTSDETFGTYSSQGPCGANERQTYVFLLRLESRPLRVGQAFTLGALIRRVLRAAGPRIGLDYVTGLSLRWTTEKTNPDADQMVKWRTDLQITINVTINTSVMLEA